MLVLSVAILRNWLKLLIKFTIGFPLQDVESAWNLFLVETVPVITFFCHSFLPAMIFLLQWFPLQLFSNAIAFLLQLFSVAIISVIRTFLLQFGYRECLEFVFG
jgi:hypothetical protein